MAILDINTPKAPAAQATTTGGETRKKSDFWLNVGVKLPGMGENGEDLIVSLPLGIALDDMKHVEVRGQNQRSIEIAQTKNALLDALRKFGSTMSPGQREELPQLTVEIYRRNEPAQQGTPENNSLVAALLGQLSKPVA